MRRFSAIGLGLAFLCGAILTLGSPQLARAQSEFDVVRLRGEKGTPPRGTISGMTALKVTITVSGTAKEFPVNEIDHLEFSGESAAYRAARRNAFTGKYAELQAGLEKFDPEEFTRPEIRQDYEFYRAMAAGKLALAGAADPAAAGKELLAFVNNHPNNYHHLIACELLGDLLVAVNNPAAAQPYYAKVAAAPFPDFKLRATVALGRSQVAQNKYADGLRTYEAALATAAGVTGADELVIAASIGKAECLAETGKPAEGHKLIEETIKKIGADDIEMNARAYNAIGRCYKAEKNAKDALLAYLRVEVQYRDAPEPHAEALYNMALLFPIAVNKPDRASDAKSELFNVYPTSRWARMLSSGGR